MERLAPLDPRIESEHPLILDVRETYEREEGCIQGSVHMPMMMVPDRLAELPKDRLVLVQCAAGVRSLQVAAFLEGNGFRTANLEGGLYAWVAAGKPVVLP